MGNINLIFMVSAILLTANPALAMEGNEEDSSKIPDTSIMQPIIPHEKKELLMDLGDLSIISIEKTTEPLLKRKVSKTLPFKRRKSPGSPRVRSISLPKTIRPDQTTAFLEDQRKDHEQVRDSSLRSGEKKISPSYIITTFQEEKKASSRPGFKRYSLLGPIEYKQVHFPFPNSFQDEQKISPGRDGALSPTRKLRDPIL